MNRNIFFSLLTLVMLMLYVSEVQAACSYYGCEDLTGSVTHHVRNGNVIYTVGQPRYYSGAWGDSIMAIDVSVPKKPKKVWGDGAEESLDGTFGQIAHSSITKRLAVGITNQNTYRDEIRIYSTESPLAPVFLYKHTLPDLHFLQALAFAPNGSGLIMSVNRQDAGGQNYLQALSVSNTVVGLSIPIPIPKAAGESNWSSAQAVNSVQNGNYVYLVGEASLKIVNMARWPNVTISTTPFIPEMVDGYYGYDFLLPSDNNMIISGNYLYLTRDDNAERDALYTFSLSNAQSPQLVDVLPIGAGGYGADFSALAVSYNRDYLIAFFGLNGYLPILSLADPAHPATIANPEATDPICNSIDYFTPGCHRTLPRPEAGGYYNSTPAFIMLENYMYTFSRFSISNPSFVSLHVWQASGEWPKPVLVGTVNECPLICGPSVPNKGPLQYEQ